MYKKKIDARLERFLDKRTAKAAMVSPLARQALEHIREFNLRGGKRIRPILVILGYKACGGRDEKAIIDAALAVELMESFLLIHDDIIDRDELRRGYLTVHRIYENKAKRDFPKVDSIHYGNSMAIILGDIAAIIASEAILTSDFPLKAKLAAVDRFSKVVVNTCLGQMLDIHSEIEPIVTEEDVLRMHKLKTAIYTVDGPLAIGGLLAGADKHKLRALSRFAIPLGMAFQLKDDILGLFGDRQQTGKAVGNDIREGKKTLLILKAMEICSPAERKFISSSLGRRDISEKDILRIRELVKTSGSLDYSNDLASRLIKDAKRALRKADLKEEPVDMLLELADYVLNRNK
jgi:geranylgeranyl diphosphate synthase, type I